MDGHDYVTDQGQGSDSPALSSASSLINYSDRRGIYQNPPVTAHSRFEFHGQGDYDRSECELSSNNPSLLSGFLNRRHVSVTPPTMDHSFDRTSDHGSPRSPASVSSLSYSHSHPSSPSISAFGSLATDCSPWSATTLSTSEPPSIIENRFDSGPPPSRSLPMTYETLVPIPSRGGPSSSEHPADFDISFAYERNVRFYLLFGGHV